MAFKEKPLTLNDQLDSVVALRLTHTMSTISSDQSGKTKILFCKLTKINVIAGLEMVK